jgi:hypothetical protein
MNSGVKFNFAIVLISLVMLTGCVTPIPESPEVASRARAQAWLDALMAFDIKGIYSFTSPAYQSAHTARTYSRNYAGRNMWKTAELGEIRCDGAEEFGACKVELVITYRAPMMREDMTRVLTETWVQIDGVWYTQPRL